MTDWAKRAAIDPMLSDALRGAGMILDLSPPQAAEAVACALRAHADDRAAMTVLRDVSPVWDVLDENHLRRMREIMDTDEKTNPYAQVNGRPQRVKAVDPEVARLRAQLEDAQRALEDERDLRFKQFEDLRHTFKGSAHWGVPPGAFIAPGTEKPETSLFGDIMREVGKHAAHGAKAELSSRAQKAIVSGVRQLAPQLPKSPVYDAIIAVLAPVLLLAAGRVAQEYMDIDEDAFTGKLLAGVTEGAGLALEGTSKETVRSVISGAAPALMQLAAVTRPELAAGGYDDE